jgi:hypothetical protein
MAVQLTDNPCEVDAGSEKALASFAADYFAAAPDYICTRRDSIAVFRRDRTSMVRCVMRIMKGHRSGAAVPGTYPP